MLEWLKRAERRHTVVLAVDVVDSVSFLDEFLKSSVRAEHLDGTTAQDNREAILVRLGKTVLALLDEVAGKVIYPYAKALKA